MAAVAQSLTVSGTAGITATSGPPSGPISGFIIPEGGMAFPDFDMRVTYAPDSDDVPGSARLSHALGLGSMPLVLNVHGTSIANLQANRRALEAAFSQADEMITLSIGGQTEVYPMFPTWPKWGAVNSGGLILGIVVATLTVPVNPMVVA